MGKIEMAVLVCSILVFMGIAAYAEQCGHQMGGEVCPGGLCCSKDGWCGTSIDYCGAGCQSQCTGGEPTPTPPSVPQCGTQAGGALCAGGLCCSKDGWCGTSIAYCGDGCQSQCGGEPTPTPPPPPPPPPTPTPPPSGEGVSSIITESVFNEMFKHRTEGNCVGKFYVYDDFITAAKAFPGFGTNDDPAIQKKELAAFFGQTSQETTGWWATATDPYAWGYCYLRELNPPEDYCTSSLQYPCAPGQKYYGRGPMQISHNYNYIPAGNALDFDGLNDPDIVARDPVISFKTAIWFWMTAQSPKPSCHDVITGVWNPTADDKSANRVAGYGLLTNIINGGNECGKGFVQQEKNRIGYYTRYCGMLEVSDTENLSCEKQTPYGLALSMTTEEAQIIKTVVE